MHSKPHGSLKGLLRNKEKLEEDYEPVYLACPSLKQVFNTGFSRNRVWIGLYLNGFGLVSKSVEPFEVGGLKLSLCWKIWCTRRGE
ncbi:hypothetical protein QL285_033316 [Trifolium repens]|nr:hypothetical protein QL285_033316 [Trifolium repens]